MVAATVESVPDRLSDPRQRHDAFTAQGGATPPGCDEIMPTRRRARQASTPVTDVAASPVIGSPHAKHDMLVDAMHGCCSLS